MNKKQTADSSAQNDSKPLVSGSGFRIVQNMGKFYIQKKFIETKVTGFLWFRKEEKVEVWQRITIHGHPLNIHNYSLVIDEFSTLEEADEYLENFKSEPIYHYR
jgi:hypothetical protein